MTQISVRVDGESYTDHVEPRTLLVHYLRERLGKVATRSSTSTSPPIATAPWGVCDPIGAKGVGEAGCIASTPAVVNAALDAVRHLGVSDIRMPLTPERVWRAIHEGGDGGARGTAPMNAQAAASGQTPAAGAATATSGRVAGGWQAWAIAEAAGHAAEGTSPSSDLNAQADYRQHLAQVLTRRAVTAAAGL